MTNSKSKKAQFQAMEQKQKKRKSTAILTFAGLAVVVVGLFLVLNHKGDSAGSGNNYSVGHTVSYISKQVEMTDVQADLSTGKMSIPLGAVEKDSIIYSEYDANFDMGDGQKGLAVLAYVSPSGKIVTAISYCQPCAGRKFHIDGDALVCNTCGTRWSLEDLSGIDGGCTKYPPKDLKYSVDKQGSLLNIDPAQFKNL